MLKEFVKVQTVTPLFTGDAYGEFNKLKTQSLLGSLRFWFEVYCFVVGKLKRDYKKEKVAYKKFGKTIQEIINQNDRLTIFEVKKQALEKLGISAASQVFGCNGWEGFIKINRIHSVEKRDIKVPLKICKEKGEDKWAKNYHNNRNYHSWYFPRKYFYGHFTIEFQLMDESIKETVLYPLLNFIQRYGFMGAKNNLGFGRVKFQLQDKNLLDYDVFKYLGEGYNIDHVVESDIHPFNELYKQLNKIGLYKKEVKEIDKRNFFIEIIKELIKEKSEERYNYKKNNPKNKYLRHFIFGATSRGKEETNATKIIPWINKLENNRYEYGFISLVLLKNFPGE